MSWFFFAVIARLGWAACNLADHYTARRLEGRSNFTVLTLTNIFIFPLLALVALFYGLPTLPDTKTLLWIVTASCCAIGGLVPYYIALKRDEAYNIIPLFEFTPVFVMLFGFFFLGEDMGVLKTALGLGCIGAGFLFLWDFERGHIRMETLSIMMLSASMFAAYQVIGRDQMSNITPYDFVFWEYACMGTITTVIGLMNGTLRQGIDAVREMGRRVVAPAAIAQVTGMFATFCILCAFVTAPTAGHVAALSGTQPVFVFILSQMLSYRLVGHYPRLGWTRDVQIKLALMAVMIACAAGLKLL